MSNKIVKNYKNVIEEIVAYLGEGYRKEIESRAKKVKLLIVDKNDKRHEYIKDEPVCVKTDKYNCCIISREALDGQNGNVLVVHSLLRALLEDSFVIEGKDSFDSTLVNYMANDICKRLEDKDINLSYHDEPEYDSKSIYSKFFGVVESFFKGNRENVIKAKLSKNFKISDSIKEVIEKFESKFEEKLERKDTLKMSSMGR